MIITFALPLVRVPKGERLVRQSVDPCSWAGVFGLGARLTETEWLYAHVFSRPPQAVIYETLLLCAEVS